MFTASERVGTSARNIILQGDCLQACAFLKEQGLQPDLVYIDPPFASSKAYKKPIYLRPLPGRALPAQVKLTPSWQQTVFQDNRRPEDFLAWMRPNLQAIYDVLSADGVIFVHLDHHISHYVKVVLDEIFGRENFRNEIIWGYKTGGTSKRAFAQKHDSIFFYSRGRDYVFNPQYYRSYQAKRYNYNPKYPELWDEEAQRWYHLAVCRDIWEDINVIGTERDGSERLDFPTQKPLALLQRIIAAASREGQLAADFFGGSGVCAAAAYGMGRSFFHSDVSPQSIITCRDRLLQAGAEFTVYHPDAPLDLRGADQEHKNADTEPEADISAETRLDVTVVPQSGGYWQITVNSYRVPHLEQKIAALNAKARRSTRESQKQKIITHSASGLEFLEWLSADCENAEGCWHSGCEVYIDARGQTWRQGKITGVWNGRFDCARRPLRLKVRDVTGRETIFPL